MSEVTGNPAEIAAEEAQDKIRACVDSGARFLVEAGAGAGKTESLIRTLSYLISARGDALLRQGQQIACITYTNVATDEIKSRIDGHPAVAVSTIHAFCWTLIKNYQAELREGLVAEPSWKERVAEVDGIGSRRVEYDLGIPRAKKDEDRVCLGHNDVLALTVVLLNKPKFRELITNRFPVVLIDEYQDTNKDVASSLTAHFLDTKEGPLLGFFGDHWQKIYGEGCGKIDDSGLVVIDKGANFRSAPAIVSVLNRLRPSLVQQVTDPSAIGSASVFHTNIWNGTRRSGAQWAGDLPAEVAHDYYIALRHRLEAQGWDFGSGATKILMLTHRSLGAEQGYEKLLDVFPYTDSLFERKDKHIAFLLDVVEPAVRAFEGGRFGEMFRVLGGHAPRMKAQSDKECWSKDMRSLVDVRATATVGGVMDQLKRAGRPVLPEGVSKREDDLAGAEGTPDEEVPLDVAQLRKLRAVQYSEIIAVDKFIDGHTVFSTKHGVKGAQFENVLAVFGRGWNHYDFNKMLEWIHTGVPKDKQAAFERNRNLFYVVCSRPKRRLALLFTHSLSDAALSTLKKLFGDKEVHDAPLGVE